MGYLSHIPVGSSYWNCWVLFASSIFEVAQSHSDITIYVPEDLCYSQTVTSLIKLKTIGFLIRALIFSALTCQISLKKYKALPSYNHLEKDIKNKVSTRCSWPSKGTVILKYVETNQRWCSIFSPKNLQWKKHNTRVRNMGSWRSIRIIFFQSDFTCSDLAFMFQLALVLGNPFFGNQVQCCRFVNIVLFNI